MARVNPVPWVVIGDNRIPACSDTYGSLTTVLDDLAITWGQGHPSDGRTASKATVRLYDPTGDMFRRRASDDLLGTHVIVGWTAGAVEHVMFRGRVSGSDMELTRRSRISRVGRGWLVSVTATDPSADLSQFKVPNDTVWPAESAILRANRVKDTCATAGVLFDEVYFPPDMTTYPMGSLDVSNKSMLELLDQFYASFGMSWTYRPDNNVTRPHQIRAEPPRPFVWKLPGTNDHVMSGWAALAVGGGADVETYYDTVLFPCELEPTDRASIDRRDSFNYIDLTYRRANGTEFHTYYNATFGGIRRTLQHETWLNLDSPNQGNVVPVWANLNWLRWSTNWPQHPPLRWRVPDDGFYGLQQARMMTRCAQSISIVHIDGDPYAASIGTSFPWEVYGDIVPRWADYQVIGGVTRYVKGRWQIDFQPGHLGYGTFTNTGDFLLWSDIQTGLLSTITWNSPTGPRWHESLAWADMRRIHQDQSTPVPNLE